MRLLWLVVLVCALQICPSSGQKRPQYNVNVDILLNNQRIMTNYIKCLMDEGPCTQEGREIKRALPEAMANGCVRCTEKQKVNLERISRYLMEKRPKEWLRLIRKYDPQNLHKINKHPVYHN